MSDLEDRLIRCFLSVFPALTATKIRAFSKDSMAEWDSLAAITLVAVIQEEFSVEIDVSVLYELDSFAAFQTYLRQRGFKAE